MSDEDDSLNVSSEAFDPLRALYSPNVRLPCPSAPILDNISKYTSYLRGRQAKKEKPKEEEPVPGPSTSSLPGRRFLPHQMPVEAPRPARFSRDVLTRSEEISEGPLSVLRACMDRRLRVKVYTRNMNDVRGHCEAFIAAFDKHWNLALEDVREVWRRKLRRKVPALDSAVRGSCTVHPARYKPPRVTTVPLGRGMEMCERHVGQLLVRGEQIVLVAVADYKPAAAATTTTITTTTTTTTTAATSSKS